MNEDAINQAAVDPAALIPDVEDDETSTEVHVEKELNKGEINTELQETEEGQSVTRLIWAY